MSMTVAELRIELNNYDDDTLVVQAKDEEGNGYSPTYEASGGCMYLATTTYSGALLDDDEHDDAAVRCVVLWPTN